MTARDTLSRHRFAIVQQQRAAIDRRKHIESAVLGMMAFAFVIVVLTAAVFLVF